VTGKSVEGSDKTVRFWDDDGKEHAVSLEVTKVCSEKRFE
jgi:hypothetical protein